MSIDRYPDLMRGRPPEGLGFAAATLDRSAQLRTRPDLLAELAAAEDTRFYAFCGEAAVLRRTGEGGDPLFLRSAVPGEATETVFLGREGEAARFAVQIAPEREDTLKADPALALVGLRALAIDGRLSPAHLGAIAQGKALLHWHGRHRFCANCGGPTRLAEGGWKRICDACSAEHFPRTDPVVIMLTLDGDRCLLGRSPRFPPGMMSCLAGFVEPGETIEDAVRRETFEEAGILAGEVRLMANQPWPFPMSLMIGAFVEARSTKIAVDLDELEDCRWFTRDEVRQMIEGQHPEGLTVPVRMAIASHLIRHFVAGG